MYIKQNERVFIRNVGDVCFFQNRAHNTDIMFGGSAKEFAKFLKREPQEFGLILDEVCKVFYNTDKNILEKDLKDFFAILEDTGMISVANTKDECIQKDKFDYSEFDPDRITYQNAKEKYSNKETSVEMKEYLKQHPTLMSFQIEIASCCNERCIHCYIPHADKTEVMSYKMFEKTVKELNDMGCIGLVLSGGEPMTNPKFIDFLKLTQKYDFAVSILSNLTLMIDEILEELKKMRQVSIQVSLYSMNPEIHDAVTCLPGSFEKTKSAIEKLVENNIIVQVSSPAMKVNKDSFKDVIHWCEDKMKIRAHTDYAIMAEQNGCTDNLCNRLSLEETRDFINNLIENDVEYQKMLKEQSLDRPVERVINPDDNLCGVGIDMAAMNVNGDVIPCSGFESLKCGNIMDKSLQDIWENSEVMKMLRNLKYKDFPQCLECEDKAYCNMCIKRHEGETGDIKKRAKHFCYVAKINREVAEEWRKKINQQK